MTEKSKKLFSGLGIFTEAEAMSRYHVRLERYLKNLIIEVETLRSMVDTLVLPACYAYHGMLASTVASAKAAGVAAPQAETLSRITTLIANLQSERTSLESLFHKAEGGKSEEDKAKAFATDVSTAMAKVRGICDELEAVVADDYWPVPKYREMLFLA